MEENKLFVEVLEVSGFTGAMLGMRNPMNSWYKMDSYTDNNGNFIIGKNDMQLAKNLIKGGAEHRKFLRMIQVQLNINMPRYIWSEFDTYSFNTKNSCSTMHKLFNNDDEKNKELTYLDELLHTRGDLSLDNFFYDNDDKEFLQLVVDKLNELKKEYLVSNGKDKIKILRRAKQLLPEGYLQMRTVSTNYEELINIYKQRKSHRLNLEWGLICNTIENLPYMKELMNNE